MGFAYDDGIGNVTIDNGLGDLPDLNGFWSSIGSGIKSGVSSVWGTAAPLATAAAGQYLGIRPPNQPSPGQQAMQATAPRGVLDTSQAIFRTSPPAAPGRPGGAPLDEERKGGGMMSGLPKWALPVGLGGGVLLLMMMMRKRPTHSNPRRRRRRRR